MELIFMPFPNIARSTFNYICGDKIWQNHISSKLIYFCSYLSADLMKDQIKPKR